MKSGRKYVHKSFRFDFSMIWIPKLIFCFLIEHRIVVFLFLISNYSILQGQTNVASVQMSYFSADVTPSIGSPLAFGVAKKIELPLSARGIVLVFDGEPVVLCAVDWIGIANEGLEVFRHQLASAARTNIDRVSIHAVHQHDAPRCDFLTARLLEQHDNPDIYYDSIFLHKAIQNIADSVRHAMSDLQPVSHVGFGKAKVNKVASNRRIMDHYGNFKMMRWHSSELPELTNAPEGLIDPWLKMITLWNDEEPLVSLSYYSVHPVSHFGDGVVSPDFVGIARNFLDQKKGYPHIYFTGAAGNTAAGKYNDGSNKMRYVLASRMAMAMDEAEKNTVRKRVTKADFKWKSTKVYFPMASYMKEDSLQRIAAHVASNPKLPYLRAVTSLAWMNRIKKNYRVQITALKIGEIQLLHLPGEPFVEYQLAAQKFFPDQHIATAAYTEFGLGYIGTAKAYSQGGYETSMMSTQIGPESEKILLNAIQKVLK